MEASFVSSVREQAKAGRTVRQTSDFLGVDIQKIYYCKKKYGIAFVDGTKCHVYRETTPHVNVDGRRQIAVRMDADVYEELVRCAQQSNISVSRYLSEFISGAFSPDLRGVAA